MDDEGRTAVALPPPLLPLLDEGRWEVVKSDAVSGRDGGRLLLLVFVVLWFSALLV